LAARLRPVPLEELKRSPDPLAAMWGLLLRVGEGKGRGEGRGPQRHFLATPPRGGIEVEGWERE